MSPQRDVAAVTDPAQSAPATPDKPPTNHQASTDTLLQPATNCYNIPREKQALDAILAVTRPEPPQPDETPRPNPDLNSQELIAHHTKPLTLQQLSAIDYIVTGRSDAEVARLLTLHRVTLTRWRLYNHVFQAELNRRRQEIWGAAADPSAPPSEKPSASSTARSPPATKISPSAPPAPSFSSPAPAASPRPTPTSPPLTPPASSSSKQERSTSNSCPSTLAKTPSTTTNAPSPCED